MATSFGALCTDFYINQKLSLKMDLPSERETILHLFDQTRRVFPDMDRFRRFDGEVLLESGRRDATYQWLSLRRNSVRSGFVNPDEMNEAYSFHQKLLKVMPYHLTISPLDIDHMEMTFGFDLECKGNHDEVVYEALYGDSPVGSMLRIADSKPMDVQPIFGLKLPGEFNTQVFFEVRTRRRNRRGGAGRFRHEPISLYLFVRRFNPVESIDDLPRVFQQLAQHAEELATDHLVPSLLTPISRRITSGGLRD